MCGIFGFVTSDPAFAAGTRLDRSVRALSHRGPDDHGVFEGEARGVRCGFAHTRLAIIDLSPGGHQPMTSDDERYTLVYNGEIYNYVEIRRELARLGVHCRSSSDTEVLLRAFAQWGPDCVHRLRGMFAFAVWDSREGQVFLARDRLGIKPLYYRIAGGTIAFASEIRALIASGAVEPKLSARGVDSYLALGSVAEPYTILEGVWCLPPGCHLTSAGASAEPVEYWHLPYAIGPAMSFDEACARTRALVDEAVKLRLVADVPVGIFLSGGIDSSAIVAFAAAASTSPLHTFTVTFDEDAFSEAAYAAEVARRFGCDHHQVNLPASEAARKLDDAVAALDQPSADGVNTYFVARAARQAGLRVALSGLGGDEVFAGYGWFRRFGWAIRLARASRGVDLPALLKRVGAQPFGLMGQRAQKVVSLLAARPEPREVYAVLRSMFTEEQRRTLLIPGVGSGELHVSLPDRVLEAMSEGATDAVAVYAALELQNYLRNTLLRDADVMSMAHALEVRVPLLDHVLVEQVMRLPGNLKLQRDVNKPLLALSAPNLPRGSIMRRKMGFTLPFDVWLRGSLQGWVEDILLGEPVRSLRLLDPRGVELLWRGFLRGDRYVSSSRVWCVAALASWCHRNHVSS